MARVIDIKCPKCAAPLPIAADATTVTCRYCGGTSVIERPGRTLQPPPGQTVVHVPATPAVNPAIQRAFVAGVVQKEYLALCAGQPPAGMAPVGVNTSSRLRSCGPYTTSR